LARQLLAATGYLDTYRSRPRLDLPSLLEHYDLEWYRRPFDDLSGALLRVGGVYRVVTNARHRLARQRFTAAHEFKHYLTDRHLSPGFACRRYVDNRLEREANVFARDLLMPAEVLGWLWGQGYHAPEQIGRALGVSAQAVDIRMAELEIGPEKALWG